MGYEITAPAPGEVSGAARLLAHVFIPLPDALGVPNELVHISEGDTGRQPEATQSDPQLKCVFRFHQVPLTAADVDSFTELMDVARTALPNGVVPQARDASDLLGPPPVIGARTVVEVAFEVPLATDKDSEIHRRLDFALHALRQVQAAQSMITNTWTTLVTRELLPMMVPAFYLDPEGEWTTSSLVVNPGWIRQIAPAKELSEEEFESLWRTATKHSRGDPITLHRDLLREARVQLWRFGNTRAAAVFAYTAGEVMLDALLQFLMWEDSTPPQEAARLFHGSGLATRIKRDLPPRLGGDWNGPTMQRWKAACASLRHRVVHAGYEPDGSEVTAALDANAGLGRFVRDRLIVAEASTRFPRTLLTFVGSDSDAVPPRLRERLDALKGSPDEPWWLDRWLRWKDLMRASLNELDDAMEPPTAVESLLVLVVDEHDARTWYEHDDLGHRARAVTPANEIDLEPLVADATARGARIPFALRYPARPFVVTGEWVPDHECIPDRAIFHLRPQHLPR